MLHGGVDPASSRLVRVWLSLCYRVARPLARVNPDLLTVCGLVLALGVAAVAALGGRWPLVAVVLVVLSGLVDSLDGAVAVLAGRTSRWGYVLDSVTDRLSDGAYVAALYVLGAPGELAVAAVALAWLQEYVRARAGAAGMSEVGVVTIAERPTRVIGTALFLLGAGLYPHAAASWALAGTMFWVTVGTVGLVQLLVVVHRWARG